MLFNSFFKSYVFIMFYDSVIYQYLSLHLLKTISSMPICEWSVNQKKRNDEWEIRQLHQENEKKTERHWK